jgi:hypothetical protein
VDGCGCSLIICNIPAFVCSVWRTSRRNSIRIASLRFKFWTLGLQYWKQEHHLLDGDARLSLRERAEKTRGGSPFMEDAGHFHSRPLYPLEEGRRSPTVSGNWKLPIARMNRPLLPTVRERKFLIETRGYFTRYNFQITVDIPCDSQAIRPGFSPQSRFFPGQIYVRFVAEKMAPGQVWRDHSSGT